MPRPPADAAFNDSGDSRKYRTEIPNIVFTLGLTPYELTLYVHMKRTAGEDGTCWKSTATLATETKMSTGMVTKAKEGLLRPRAELGNKALITIRQETNEQGGKPRHLITLADLWPANVKRFASSPRERTSSPHEIASSPGEIKKEPLEEIKPSAGAAATAKTSGPVQQIPATSHARLMWELQRRTGAIPDGARQGKAVKWLLEHGYSEAECVQCLDAMLREDWRTARVSWLAVQNEIGTYRAKHQKSGRPKAVAL